MSISSKKFAQLEIILNQPITKINSISTGLNKAYQAKLADGSQVFIKTQPYSNDLLIKEAKELSLLGQFIRVPQVIYVDKVCLVLEWIQTNDTQANQILLAQQLAILHQQTGQTFGFEFDNKIGTTPQINAVGKNIDNWANFYWDYRLKPQIDLAYQNQSLSEQLYQDLLKIKPQLSHLLPDEVTPVLLHGDLWSGNVIYSKTEAVFIDCACYYGHSEADLALTRMFGGFSSDFYQTYHHIHPKQVGFEKRQSLYQLYHYLNHVNLFGSGYLSGVNSCVKALF